MSDYDDPRKTANDLEARTEQVLRAWHRRVSDEAPTVPLLAEAVDGIPDRLPFRRSVFGTVLSRRMQLIIAVALLLTALAAGAIAAGLGRPYRPVITDSHWEILSIGDAFADAGGWPRLVAESMAADLGIEVAAASRTCLGDCGGTEGPLDRILASEVIQTDIRDAEVIFVQPQPGWVVLPTLRAYFGGECGGDDGRDCLRAAVADYRVDIGELLDELSALSGPGTVIRVVPTDAHVIRHWNPSASLGGAIDPTFELGEADPEAFAVVIDWYRALMEAGIGAAADRCIPVWDANVYFSGADYRDPPAAENFDGFALTAAGQRIVADHVLDLGYRPRLAGCSPAGS
jgi:hypothetical protein